MNVYADTKVLTNLWMDMTDSEDALALAKELTNALQRLVYKSRDGSQGMRVPAETVLAAHGVFQEQLDAGVFLEQRSPRDDILESEFEVLSFRFTSTEGFRTYNIMHVESAPALG